MPYECADILDLDQWPKGAKNGVYTLIVGRKRREIKAYCDMEGGGWTVNIRTFLSTEVICCYQIYFNVIMSAYLSGRC